MSDFKITVPLSDYEEKTRDQVRMEIVSELLQTDIYVSDSILKIVCGLQVEKEKAPYEPAIMVEKIEELTPPHFSELEEGDGKCHS